MVIIVGDVHKSDEKEIREVVEVEKMVTEVKVSQPGRDVARVDAFPGKNEAEASDALITKLFFYVTEWLMYYLIQVPPILCVYEICL